MITQDPFLSKDIGDAVIGATNNIEGILKLIKSTVEELPYYLRKCSDKKPPVQRLADKSFKSYFVLV